MNETKAQSETATTASKAAVEQAKNRWAGSTTRDSKYVNHLLVQYAAGVGNGEGFSETQRLTSIAGLALARLEEMEKPPVPAKAAYSSIGMGGCG